MTGLEKFGVSLLAAAVAGLQTPAVPRPAATAGDWVMANWPILCAVVAIAVAWGALTQRMNGVEKKTDELAKTCATKESVDATKDSVETLAGHVNDLVRMLDRRGA